MPGRTLKETRSGLAAMVAGQPDCFTTACDPERRASGQLVSQSLSQVEHGLGVDLAGAALGHPENLADLGKVQAFVVVQREHLALAFIQPLDGLRQLSPGLFKLDGLTGNGPAVLQSVAEGLAATSALSEQDVVEL